MHVTERDLAGKVVGVNIIITKHSSLEGMSFDISDNPYFSYVIQYLSLSTVPPPILQRRGGHDNRFLRQSIGE